MRNSPCLASWDAFVVNFCFCGLCACMRPCVFVCVVDDGIIRNFLRVDACAKLADKVSSCHNMRVAGALVCI